MLESLVLIQHGNNQMKIDVSVLADESGEAGDILFEKLEERNFSVNDLMNYLQGTILLDLLQLIKQDLGKLFKIVCELNFRKRD